MRQQRLALEVSLLRGSIVEALLEIEGVDNDPALAMQVIRTIKEDLEIALAESIKE